MKNEENKEQQLTIEIIKEIMPIVIEKEKELNKDLDLSKSLKIPYVVTTENIDELTSRHVHGLIAFLVENRNPIITYILQINNGFVEDVFVNPTRDFELIMQKISKQMVILCCNIALDEIKGESKFANLIAIGNYKNMNNESIGFSIVCDSPDKLMNDYLTLVSAFENNPKFKDEHDILDLAEHQKVDLFHKGIYFNSSTIKALIVRNPEQENESKNEESTTNTAE